MPTAYSVLFWGRVSISFIHIIYYPLETLKTVVEVWVGEQRRHLKKYIKKMELPFDLAIPLLGSFSKNPETPIQKNLCTPMFIAALFTVAKCWKQPKCPSVNEWVKKLWYISTMEFYAAEKKKELLLFMTAWMELETIMLSEISQVVKDQCHMISPISGT